MSRFFMHIWDGGKFFADSEGVEAAGHGQVHPHIQQMVRDIVRDEGGSTIDDSREVEVTDEAGQTVLTVAFRTITHRH